jgi:arylsulfatase A-like enzyme
VRVPFLVSGAGVRRRGAVDHQSLVSLIDILPTFCDFAGVPAPSAARGASLKGALEGKPLDREFVVSELRYGDETREGRMVRSARFKYIVFNGGANPEQLFDRETDPGEILNLARNRDYAKVLAGHREILRRWIKATEDDFRPVGD